MKTTFEERSILSHAIYCRIFWLEDFLKTTASEELQSPVLKSLNAQYSEEKAILENILKKLF